MSQVSQPELDQRIADVAGTVVEVYPEVRNFIRDIFLGHLKPFLEEGTKPTPDEIDQMAEIADQEAAQALQDLFAQPEVQAVVTSSESFKWLVAELHREEIELLQALIPGLLIEITKQLEGI